LGRNYLPGTPPLPARATRPRGKHRTEVTEVTEGDRRFGAKLLAGDTTALVRETRASGKDRTEVTGVTERRLGWLGECANGDTVGLGKKTTGVQPSASSGSVGFFVCGVFFQLTISCFA
jgi:hypothetical protein